MNKRKDAAKRICAGVMLLALLTQLCSCGLFVIQTYEESTGADATSAPVSSETEAATSSPAFTEPEGQKFSELSVDYTECMDAVKLMDDENFSVYTLQIRISDACNDIISGNDSFMTEYCEIRNNMVTEKFNTKDFLISIQSQETLTSDLAASIKSGASEFAYFSDILVVPEITAGKLASSGYLMNLRNLSFYTLNYEGSSAAGLNYTSNYIHVSDLTYDITGTAVMFFNRSLAGEELTKELYSAALSDSFTFEFLLEKIAESKSSAEYSLSVYSGGAGYEFLADIAAIRTGYKFVTNEKSKYPTLKVNTEDDSKALSDLIGSLKEVNTYIPAADANASDAYSVFTSGKSLFHIGTVGDITTTLYKEKIAWGVLPLPSAATDGVSVENIALGGRPVIVVPSNNSKNTFTGVMLTALDTATGSWMREGYANKCAEFMISDNTSFFTLKKALEPEMYCDFARIYADSVNGLNDSCYGAIRDSLLNGTDFTETVEKNRKTVNNLLKKLKK